MKVARRHAAAGLLSLVTTVSALMLLGPSTAQYAPPPAVAPSAEIQKKIEELKDKLGRDLSQLRQLGIHDPALGDIEVYYKAASWITRHNEFYEKEAGEWTVEALKRGLLRAGQQSQGEIPWYLQTGMPVVHGYRSAIDGTVQPYAVTFPADYGSERSKKYRVEVVLHGRDNSLTEIKFLHQHNGEKPAPKEQDYVRIDVYGRGNNGYRWAGESDVNEVIDHFLLVEKGMGRQALLDASRGVLRGFSMGGAGAWHLGLHTPGQWCAISPGAGFVTTHGYVKNLEKLTPEQEACLHIYDAADYAENAFNVPVVAYAGGKDPQLQAARTIEERLKELKIPMKLVVAPDLGHQFPAEWQKKVAEAYSEYTAKGREEYPRRVRFVTYTLRYPVCYWVEIERMGRHYERASVDAERTEEGFKIKTANVRALGLQLWPGASRQIVKVEIDGQTVEAQPYLPNPTAASLQLHLQQQDGKWRGVLPEKLVVDQLRRPRKTSGQQGPIDDAFMKPFLCVRGTGPAWHEATDKYAKDNLERFRDEWSKYLRGELPVKDDTEVTPQDIASRHLILFGDPSSNSLIAEVLDGLPIRWTREKITLEDKEYAAGEHVPVMIYPSPLSPTHYVVLNSGHTFHAREFQGTNALLYPRLGDYAILKLKPQKDDPLAVEVQRAGLFDDSWKVSPREKK
jgi:pimeloyl-ACP methyl ester carboxylesterase